MKQMTDEIIYILDGQSLPEDLIKNFDLSVENGDYKFKSNNIISCDFVGFVTNKDGKLLVSLPKHYEILDNSITNLGLHDIHLLFNVLLAYSKQMDNNRSDLNDKVQTSYPFNAFFEILEYYKKYGLYREIEKSTKAGYSGNISWKDTIRKSTKIFNNNNLIFLPLQVKKQLTKEVFLSDCMAFALTYTINQFPYFIEDRVSIIQPSNFDFWNNKQYVVQKLIQIHSELFKDIHKNLVRSLIDFYSNIGNNGKFYLKHNKFQNIWESMITKYLNKYFVSVGLDGLQFDTNQKKSEVHFYKHNEKIDLARGFELNPDHYYINPNKSVQYIFDSKYYEAISSLNYKQVSYHTLMKYRAKETYSALIAPIEDSKQEFSRKHIETTDTSGHILIWEHYLSIKKVMLTFLNSNI